jgi:hypothetical protein
MCNKIISDSDIEALQVNLIKSHAAGLGDPIKPYIALAVLRTRIPVLGVTPEDARNFPLATSADRLRGIHALDEHFKTLTPAGGRDLLGRP